MHIVKIEVTNQHAKDVSSRAEWNEPRLHVARRRLRDAVGNANRKKQKIKAWLDGNLEYETQPHNPLAYGGGFTEDDIKLSTWKDEE